MISVTTPSVRNFGVGRMRRHNGGSEGPLSIGGIGADGRVGASVMHSPRGSGGWSYHSADLVALLEQRVVLVAPLLLFVQQLVHVDGDDFLALERVLEAFRL